MNQLFYFPILNTQYSILNTQILKYSILNTQILKYSNTQIPNTQYRIPNTQYPIPKDQYPTIQLSVLSSFFRFEVKKTAISSYTESGF
jgi:hypothetical protein